MNEIVAWLTDPATGRADRHPVPRSWSTSRMSRAVAPRSPPAIALPDRALDRPHAARRPTSRSTSPTSAAPCRRTRSSSSSCRSSLAIDPRARPRRAPDVHRDGRCSAIPPILVNAYAGVRGGRPRPGRGRAGAWACASARSCAGSRSRSRAGHRRRLPDRGAQRHRDGDDRGGLRVRRPRPVHPRPTGIAPGEDGQLFGGRVLVAVLALGIDLRARPSSSAARAPRPTRSDGTRAGSRAGRGRRSRRACPDGS